MKASLLAALATTTVQLDPGRAAFSHHSITLSKDGVEGEPVLAHGDSVSFTGLEPGTYIASGFSGDSEGKPMSAPVTSNSFIVPVTEANVLASITLSLGAPA